MVSLCAAALATGGASAQGTTSQTPTDSSAQASPVGPAPKNQATDSSAQASPIALQPQGGGVSLPAKTVLKVSLTEGIDSGNLRNGKVVHGKLSSDVPLLMGARSAGKRTLLRAGTPAVLTVVSTVPAGKLSAVGEISLQLLRVGNTAVDSDILTFRGTPGHRDLPDSAPAIGTNAGLPAGTSLTFHSQPSPAMADTIGHHHTAPGSVTAVVGGSKAKANHN